MRIVPPNQPVPDSGPSAGGGRSAASEPAENVAPPAAADEGAPEPVVGAEAEPRPSLSAGTSHANLVGHVLAERYRLMKLIGEGGMGSVYQAEHITIGRKLAIKVLAPEYCDSPEVVARFLQEARTASMLHHEHIVDITDFGYTKQGLAFLTMEYLEGEDLATLLSREGRQPWARLRRMILQVCRALNAAHDKGIIHRDMKPDNCFRIKRGGNPDFIKILDFGIAKVIADGQFGGREDKPKMATEAGTLLGTPEYMAPEIARDQKADARVDVYSLGILMYEMLTGSVPFKGQTFMATVAMQMVDEPQPPRQRCPEAAIPPEIEAVILTALRKDPTERYQSVRELAEAILEADRALRMTQQGLPALRFESGEYSASSSHSDSSILRASQLGERPLGNSGAFAPPRGPGSTTPASSTPVSRPGTDSHPVVATHTPMPGAGSGARGDLAPAGEFDEPSAITRPNPYRALSVLLLLVVAGLGGAIWYLLTRSEPTVDPANIGHDAVIHPGDPVPVPTIPVDTKTPPTPPETPDPTAVDPEPPHTKERPIHKKKDPPAALVDATKDDINEYINTLVADVTRCFTSSNFPRQKATFLIEVEAATGKVKANLEAPLGNKTFTACAEKAVARKRFKKGRKYTTFHASLNL